MSILRAIFALLFATGSAVTGTAQEAPAWGEAVQGAELRLAVSDGPLPADAGLLPLEAQLRNRGTAPLTFNGEAIIHPEIEIDGVWYGEVWAGSCCSAPREIPADGRSEVLSFRVRPMQTFAMGATPARTLDLKPGRHSIRIRSASIAQMNISVRIGSSPVVLTSNMVVLDIPARASITSRPSAAAPACEAGPGRRSEMLHGSVERGDRFTRPTGPGWVVRLEPVEHGWALQISTPDRPGDDLARLTPPWHAGSNPRDIEGWHFRNAGNTGPNDGSVNAPGSVRDFIFSPLVGRGLEYRGSATPAADVERVRAYGRGWLSIESYRLTPARTGERAGVESLTFWACLTWPTG